MNKMLSHTRPRGVADRIADPGERNQTPNGLLQTSPRCEVDRTVAVVTLAMLTLVGAGLRFWGANACLWIDEINCLRKAIRPPMSEIVTTFHGDIQHPLYCVLARVSIVGLGESPWALRLPAILFGIAVIPLVYGVARIALTRGESLFVAGLMAVSYHPVWFSQNARGYTALLFWTLLGTYWLYQGVVQRRGACLFGFAVAAALGAYTHLSMAIVVAGQGLAVFIYLATAGRHQWRTAWRPVVLSLGASGLLTVLIYSPMLPAMIQFFGTPSKMQGTSTPSWAMFEAMRAFQFGFQGLLGAFFLVGLAAGVIVVGWGTWSLARRDPLFCLLCTVPVVFTAIGIVLARGTLYPRYVFFGMGFGLILGVHGLFACGGWIGPRWFIRSADSTRCSTIGPVALAGLLLLLTALTLPRNYQSPKQDFAGAVRFFETEVDARDPVATLGAARWAFLDYFGLPWALLESPEQLQRMLQDPRPLWVVYTFERYIPASLRESIHANMDLYRKLPGTLRQGEVYIFREKPR